MLRSTRQCCALASDGGLPQVIHWGEPLPDADISALAENWGCDVWAGALDEHPPLSICPEASRSFPGQVGMEIAAMDGFPLRPRFTLDQAGEEAGVCEITCRDVTLDLTYRADFALDPDTDILVVKAELVSGKPVFLHWLAAPVLPAPQSGREMIDYSGVWTAEFRPQRISWTPGIRLRESRLGRTGHEHFPGLVLPEAEATNTHGKVHALHYGWSGGHRMVAEELPDGRRQIQFGHASHSELAPATRFGTGRLYAAYSGSGMNGCAEAFQRHVRDRVVCWPDPIRPRPVHFNCWEAVYFRQDPDGLREIAGRAAALGAERFVLDDGWFLRREDDMSSLGDWEVDPDKFPDGLGPLIDHVHDVGMRFGIWFEPEMVSPDSDLYRAHPDWALGPADQVRGRRQLVLDLGRAEVREHLYGKIASVLANCEIDYVKWDHNRVLPYPDAAQARGTYALLDRLRERFPLVEFESCASGGGRVDLGILERTHRVWLSDSNDALERLRMQHEAAMFLPWEVTGSHVGPGKCHTTGRRHDMRFRAWVAAQRHMGIEMDPRELTGDGFEVLARVIAWWKETRGWRAGAAIHRLDSADPAIVAEVQVARDGGRFVVFVGQSTNSVQAAPRPLRLSGLDPDTNYRLELINRDDVSVLSRGCLALKGGPMEYSGRTLMSVGLNLPRALPETIWVIGGKRLPTRD